MRIVVLKTFGFHFIHYQFGRNLIMCSEKRRNLVQMFHHKINSGIVIIISCLFIWLDWVWIILLFGSFSFLLHISATNNLITNEITFFSGSFQMSIHIFQTAGSVHLDRVPNDGFFLVVFLHHFFTKLVGRILHPGFLSIHHYFFVAFETKLTNFIKTSHYSIPFFFLAGCQLFAFSNRFININSTKSSWFENYEGNCRISHRKSHNILDFFTNRIKNLFFFFPFNRVIEDTSNATFEHLLNHFHTFFSGFATAKLFEQSLLHNPIHKRKIIPNGKIEKRNANIGHCRLFNRLEHPIGFFELSIRFIGKCELCIVENTHIQNLVSNVNIISIFE